MRRDARKTALGYAAMDLRLDETGGNIPPLIKLGGMFPSFFYHTAFGWLVSMVIICQGEPARMAMGVRISPVNVTDTEENHSPRRPINLHYPCLKILQHIAFNRCVIITSARLSVFTRI